ncbi:hypothetical protein VTK73DRAFT_9060 [Phialemonium thermophilum]|uniref:DUF7025 domain-containing protein n=1 Tax=Phialemonium thermophilum TaxID=223376 RepID=A0ABR3W5F6_9PEZI
MDKDLEARDLGATDVPTVTLRDINDTPSDSDASGDDDVRGSFSGDDERRQTGDECICDVVTLFDHSRHGGHAWSEFEDPALEERRLRKVVQSFAVVQRQTRAGRGDAASWTTTSVEAQSPRLRRVLDVVLRDYTQWYTDAAPYTATPPFKPFVHRWDTMLNAMRREKDPKTASELQLLCRVLKPPREAAPVVAGTHPQGAHARAYLLADVELTDNRIRDFCKLDLRCVDWNGAECGLRSEDGSIDSYPDRLCVTKLPYYPVDFAPNGPAINGALLARGRNMSSEDLSR